MKGIYELMRAGVSTACFYPEYPEDILYKFCKLHIQCTEIFVNCEYEISPDYVKGLKRIADSAGVEIVSLHPYTSGMEPILFFSGYDRRFNQGRELYKRNYEAANLMGAGIVVFHGGIRGLITDFDAYFEAFGILMEDARRQGVELCHENVSRCVGFSPEFFAALIHAHPNARFVFDTKQALRSGVDIMDFAQSLGSNIRHVHISDHAAGQDCLPPGKGTFNIGKFLSLITNNGFDGAVVVELYRENFDDIVEIYSAYQHLSNEISTFT